MSVWKHVGALVLVCLPLGCGRSLPDTVPVSGRVTWNGEPVRAGTIAFMPADTETDSLHRVALGRIEADGSYRLSTFGTNDGALPGDYHVAVSDQGDFAAEVRPGARSSPQGNVPARYAVPHTSGLNANVPAGSRRLVIDFHLPAGQTANR